MLINASNVMPTLNIVVTTSGTTPDWRRGYESYGWMDGWMWGMMCVSYEGKSTKTGKGRTGTYKHWAQLGSIPTAD